MDCLDLEHRMWKLLDARGAQYPAEHNVGHLYPVSYTHLDVYKRQLICCARVREGAVVLDI